MAGPQLLIVAVIIVFVIAFVVTMLVLNVQGKRMVSTNTKLVENQNTLLEQNEQRESKLVKRIDDLEEQLKQHIEVTLLQEQTRPLRERIELTADMSDEELMAWVDQEMDERLLYTDSELTLKTMAQTLGLTQKRLGELFKNNKKYNSLGDYLNEKRFLYACRLLREKPNWTIEAVGKEAGFGGRRTFQMEVKRRLGITPLQYRQGMNGITKVCGLVLMLATMLVGCTKDPIILPNPDEEQASSAPLVIVIYGPNSLGDRSYCDMIYTGVERAAQRHELRTLQFSPESYEEGLAYLETIFSEMERAADTVRRLLITPGVGYDAYIRANSHRLESNPRADLLYMETTTPLEDKGSTLYIDYYGAMYMGGCMVHYTALDYTDKELVSLVLANPHTQSVREAGEGFVAGFNDTQGHEPLALHIRYLSQEPAGGFTLSDTAAIRIIREESTYLYEDTEGIMLVPVCGGAMHSLIRAIRGTQLFASNQYIGIDGDMNADNFFCPFSIVKHVDRVMEDYIGKWLDGTMPKHQTLGLADGATGILVGNYYLPNDLNLIDMDSLWQVAVGKEAGRWRN